MSQVIDISKLTVVEIVDRMGLLKAKMAPIEKEIEELGAKLKARGKGRYEGQLYDATVSVYDRENLDMKAVRAKLSRQFIAANTTTSEVRKVEVKAKLPAVVDQAA